MKVTLIPVVTAELGIIRKNEESDKVNYTEEEEYKPIRRQNF